MLWGFFLYVFLHFKHVGGLSKLNLSFFNFGNLYLCVFLCVCVSVCFRVSVCLCVFVCFYMFVSVSGLLVAQIFQENSWFLVFCSNCPKARVSRETTVTQRDRGKYEQKNWVYNKSEKAHIIMWQQSNNWLEVCQIVRTLYEIKFVNRGVIKTN